MRAAWLHDEETVRAKIKATAFFVTYQPDETIVRRVIDALCIYRARQSAGREQRRDLARDARNQLHDLHGACENLLMSLDKVLANPALVEEAQAAGLPALGIEILNLQGAVAQLSGKRFLHVSRHAQEKVARERLIASLYDAISPVSASRQEHADIVRELLAIIAEDAEPSSPQGLPSQ